MAGVDGYLAGMEAVGYYCLKGLEANLESIWSQDSLQSGEALHFSYQVPPPTECADFGWNYLC